MTAFAAFDVEFDLNSVLPADLAARISTIVNPRARRLALRLDPAGGQIVLVVPKRASGKTVLGFVESREEWIRTHLETLPPRIPFCDGAQIPVGGADHTLRFAPERRGGVWREGHVIMIAGQAEFAARRMRDWLKGEARRELTPLVHTMADAIGCKVKQVSVRDTTSRWGSCSSDGKLSFSWRLMLAPKAVLIYVAAHEVAHLKHLHHRPTFWRTVDDVLESCVTDEAARRDARLARDWLRRHGATLHRYG